MVSFFLLKAEVTDFMSFGRNVINVSEGIGSNYNVCVRCIYILIKPSWQVWAFPLSKGGLGLSSQIIFGFRNLDAKDIEML